MVQTIYVVFTNIRLSDPQVRNMKQYKFLCPYDYDCSLFQESRGCH